MNLETLRHGNFASLDEAVRDWSRAVTQLRTLEKEARDGMRARAERADWSGANATVSRAFITKTVGEFADAATQATSIRNILRDTRGELVRHRDELNRAIERGRAKELLVAGTAGGGFTVKSIAPCGKEGAGTGTGRGAVDATAAAAEAAAVLQRERVVTREIDSLRDELQRILHAAAESDGTADRVLRALVAQAELGFSSGPSYRDRDAAAAALRSADSIAALVKKGRGLSEEELGSLKAGLKKYASDPLFAEQFAVRAGARGTLDFWADRARFEKDHELQKYLGLTLAEATRSDSPQMRAWERGMVDLGDESVSAGRREAKGFQVMSNLMRWGQFDNEFLKGYGNELIRVEKELGENGRASAEEIWDESLPLNRSTTDAGHDPMTGFMQALSKSPDAATDFFNGTFVTAKEDHEFFIDPEKEEKGLKGLSNFDYLFSERDWPVTHHSDGRESFAGPDFMASAVEAAATGRGVDEPSSRFISPHTVGQAQVMESLVSAIADDDKKLTDRPYLADSFGRIAADYLPDINRALSDDVYGNTPKLFPVTGAAADLDHAKVTRFLVAMGQTPEGNASLEYGHRIYMANLMDHHLNPDLPAGQRYPHSAEKTIEDISKRAAEISGTLTIGRQEAVLGPAREADKDFADSLSNQKNYWSGMVGTAVGVGATAVATPIGGVVAAGTATTATTMAIEWVTQQIESEELKAAGKESAVIWADRSRETVGATQASAISAMANRGHPHAEGTPDLVRASVEIGLNSAVTNTSRMADDLETEISP